jgi:hypothetical protein
MRDFGLGEPYYQIDTNSAAYELHVQPVEPVSVSV